MTTVNAVMLTERLQAKAEKDTSKGSFPARVQSAAARNEAKVSVGAGQKPPSSGKGGASAKKEK
jgi:hypothetical protein